MFSQLILFEFKGDVHLLHKKQEVELQFCGSEGWVKDIYSGYTCTALHEAHVLQQTDANFMNDEEDGEGSQEGLHSPRNDPDPEMIPLTRNERATKLRIADLGRVVALTTGMLLFKFSDFFSHIDYTQTQALQLSFVSPSKIRIQFLFHSHIAVDYLSYC